MRNARILVGVLTAVALSGLALSAGAVAGGYDVRACDASLASGANNSFVALTSPGLAAYQECPAGQGIVARTGWDNGTSSFLDGAFMIFDAPAGNVVETISFEMGIERHDCSWSVGLIASNYDLAGTRIWGVAPGSSCDSASTPGATNYFPYRWNHAINAPRVRIETRCGAPTCPRNGIAAMRIRNVDVRVRDDAAPSIGGGRGPLWTSDGWLGGSQAVGFDANDAAGVREVAVTVDGARVAAKSFPCDYTRPVPCPGGSLDEPVGTSALSDGTHTVALEATDAAGNPSSASRTVRIDNTAPDAPRDLAVDGGEGWRSRNAFDIRWTNVPQKAAPIDGAGYEICPASGDGECVRGTRSGADLHEITDLAAPSPGEYTLKVWLRDSAGNQDERIAATPVRLRYDDASPEIALEPLTAEDPTKIVASVSDRGSGLASGVIEMRRRGAEAWAQLPTTLDGAQLVARIDDERLGDGVFEFRARVADHAGNERSTTLLSDGRPAEVTLPLRLKTNLRVGMVERRNRGSRLAQSARVKYGRLVRVSGRLTSPEGNPLQDLEVQAFSQVRDGVTPPNLIATVRTSRTGRFSFVVRRGPNRTIKVRYAGAPQVRSATRVLVLSVRAATSIRPSRRSLSTGETVRFHGKVLTGRIPGTGKLVELQVRVRERWRTFATTRTGRRGTWSYRYRFDGTSGRVTYRFRARIPREAGYPFVTGDSRVVRVKVRGL